MKLTVTGRHMTVTEPLRRDITRKLGRLERLLNDSAVSAQVILGREAKVGFCELTLHARGDHMLHGVGRHERMTAAVTAAVDKVAQQAHRLKDRWKSRRRQSPRLRAQDLTPEPPPAEAPRRTRGPRVFRSKARVAQALSLDEAIVALAGEERPFLVFREAKSDAVVVLFKRPDGHFGLIDTGA